MLCLRPPGIWGAWGSGEGIRLNVARPGREEGSGRTSRRRKVSFSFFRSVGPGDRGFGGLGMARPSVGVHSRGPGGAATCSFSGEKHLSVKEQWQICYQRHEL